MSTSGNKSSRAASRLLTSFAEQLPFSSPLVFGLLFVYKCLIEAAYYFVFAPVYNYAGFDTNPNALTYFGVLALLLLVVLCMPKDTARPSTYLFFLILIFVYLPLGSYCWLSDNSLLYVFLVTLAFLLAFLCSRLRFPSLELRGLKASRILDLIFVLYVLTSLYLIVSAGGIDVRALDFSNVYEIRSEGSVTGISGYLLSWTAKVFAPFYFIYYIFRGKKLLAATPLLIQVLLYLTFAMKTYLFSVFLLLFFYLVFKRFQFAKATPIFFSMAVAAGILLAYFLDLYLIRNMWVYRMVFEPAKIEFWFYDFFQDNPFLYFSEGVIGKLFGIASPYSTTVTYVISGLHGNPYNCNTGMFSDAYAQGGFFAMLCLLGLFGIIVSLIDSASTRIPVPITTVMFSYLMVNLMDGSLLTTLLTGGLGIMLIMVFLLNSDLAQFDIAGIADVSDGS